MRKKISSIPAALALVLAALLAVGVLTFAGPCIHEDGTTGMCFGASRFAVAAAFAAVAAALVRLVLTSPRIWVMADSVLALSGVCAAFVPGTVLPLCMMATMRCNAVMKPFALLMGIGIAILGVADLMLSRRGKEGVR